MSKVRKVQRQNEKHEKSDIMEVATAVEEVCVDVPSSRATLIVVPTILLGQWWRELHNNLASQDLEAGRFEAALVSNQKFKSTVISIDSIVSAQSAGLPLNRSACVFNHNKIQIYSGMEVVFTLPWGSPGKVFTVSGNPLFLVPIIDYVTTLDVFFVDSHSTSFSNNL